MGVISAMTNRLCKIQNIFCVMIVSCNLQQEDKLNHNISLSTRLLVKRGPRFVEHWSIIIPYTDINHFTDKRHVYCNYDSNVSVRWADTGIDLLQLASAKY